MSARVTAFLLALLVSSPALADKVEWREPWTGDTANVVPDGAWQVGVFAPLRFGLTERVELSTHPLAFLLAPNLTAKVAWLRNGAVSLATEHTLVYPTPLIETLSRAGTGGLWPEETVTPTIVALHNRLLASFTDEGHVLTASAGARLAPSFGRANLTTVDLWYLYERTAHWVTGAAFDFGIAAEGPIVGDLGFFGDVTLYVVSGGEYPDGSPIVNQSGGLTWLAGDAWRLELGWWLSAGDFPGPDDWQLLPRFDVLVRW